MAYSNTPNPRQNVLVFDAVGTTIIPKGIRALGLQTAGFVKTTANGTFYIDTSGGGGGSGSVTTLSVVSANGFAGTVANATSTPAITISTTVTGLLKGNGTAVSAAVAGVDYLTANQTITLTGAVSGSGSTSIATTLGTGVVGIANLSATGTANSSTFLRGDNTWAVVSSSPGGSDTHVQFNDGGVFAGDGGFTYNKSTDTATLGSLNLTVITNATTDTDQFIVSDSGLIKYRTGTEILSDIGAIASSYLDTDTTLAANSDTKIATQKATKAYTDAKFATRFSRRHDYAGGYSYCGTAAFGSADSAAAWLITRIPINANGTVGTVQRSANNSIWNNRTSLTYT